MRKIKIMVIRRSPLKRFTLAGQKARTGLLQLSIGTIDSFAWQGIFDPADG